MKDHRCEQIEQSSDRVKFCRHVNMEVLILIIVLSFRRINHMALNHCIDPLSTRC
jgi:hypothetical protein